MDTIAAEAVSDFQYQLVKYLGGIIAALYGLFATFYDFHEEKNGKKVLSKAGRYGLVVLAVSSVWALSSDILKDRLEQRREIKRARIEEAQRAATAQYEELTATQLGKQLEESRGMTSRLGETQAALSRNLATTSTVLSETRRAVDPFIHDLSIQLYVEIPTDQPAVQDYLERIKEPISSWREQAKVGREVLARYAGLPRHCSPGGKATGDTYVVPLGLRGIL